MLFTNPFLNSSAGLEVLLLFAGKLRNKQILWCSATFSSVVLRVAFTFFIFFLLAFCFFLASLECDRFVAVLVLRRLYFNSWVFPIIIHTCLPHLRNFLNEYWLKSRCLCRINDCLNWKLNSARRCWLACKRVHIISINNYTELVEINDLKFNRNDLIIGFLLLLSHQGNSGFLSLCSFSCHEYRAWHATPPFVLYIYTYIPTVNLGGVSLTR